MNRFAVSVVFTVQLKVAGDASEWPSASVARTENVCEPFASPKYDFGAVHAVAGAPSDEQVNVDALSLEANENETFAGEVAGGAAVSVVCGAVVSTVQLYVAGAAEVLPAASVAFTDRVYEPSASAL
jgi:hypothetical protein